MIMLNKHFRFIINKYIYLFRMNKDNLNLPEHIFNIIQNYKKPKLYNQIPIIYRYKINFIILDMSYISVINGLVNNEITIMIYLTNKYDVFYNDVLINDCVFNNLLDIDKLNEKIKKRISISDKLCFYLGFLGILKPTNNYLTTFYRSVNTYTDGLFNKIHGHKIYSHNFSKNIWISNMISIQTDIGYFMIKNNIINFFNEDGTLNYNNNNSMIIPEKIFIKKNFIHLIDFNAIDNFMDLSKYDEYYKICIVGNLGLYSDYNFLLPIIYNLQKETFKKVKLFIMSNMNNINNNDNDIIEKIYLEKSKYLYFISKCDILINTYNENFIIYSQNNKLFDCISVNVPIIMPHSIFAYDTIGYDYKYYYSIKNRENDIYKILKDDILNGHINFKYNININDYNNDVINSYDNQFYDIICDFIRQHIHIEIKNDNEHKLYKLFLELKFSCEIYQDNIKSDLIDIFLKNDNIIINIFLKNNNKYLKTITTYLDDNIYTINQQIFNVIYNNTIDENENII